MSMGDRITILVAVRAISATLSVGSWSTNARINAVNTQLNTPVNGARSRIDGVSSQLNARIDDVQEHIRELRELVIDALKHGDPAD